MTGAVQEAFVLWSFILSLGVGEQVVKTRLAWGDKASRPSCIRA